MTENWSENEVSLKIREVEEKITVRSSDLTSVKWLENDRAIHEERTTPWSREEEYVREERMMRRWRTWCEVARQTYGEGWRSLRTGLQGGFSERACVHDSESQNLRGNEVPSIFKYELRYCVASSLLIFLKTIHYPNFIYYYCIYSRFLKKNNLIIINNQQSVIMSTNIFTYHRLCHTGCNFYTF